MEQEQLQTYDGDTGFNTTKQVDLIPVIDRLNARLNAADEAALQQVRANNAQRVKNAANAGKDLIALSKMSKTLTDALVERQKGINEDEKAEGVVEGYQQYLLGGLDTSQVTEGMQTAKQQDGVAQDVSSEVLGDSGENYEAAAGISKATTWREVGRRQGAAMGAVASYDTFVDDQLANQQFNSSAEYAAARAQVQKQFFKEAGLSGVKPQFLAQNVYPAIMKADNAAMRTWSKRFAIDDSARTQDDLFSSFGADKNVGSLLGALRNTVDSSGNPLGYKGAWSMFDKRIVEMRKAGLLSDRDIEQMKSQPIPGDPKGRTYGDLHEAKFKNIQRQVQAQVRTDWNNSEADRKMEFEQAEQELVNSFLDASDTDGFTDEQIDDAIDALRKTYGMNSTELSTLKANSVDAETRKVQEEQIQSLQEMGLLTPERLKEFDPKLQRKYMSVAQQQAKLSKESGGNKIQMTAIEDAVIGRVNLNKEQRNHPAVGLMVAEMQRRYQKAVTKLAIGGDENAAQNALREILGDFEREYAINGKDIKTTNDVIELYKRTTLGANPPSNAEAKARFAGIAEALKTPSSIEDSYLLTQEELKAATKNYGKPGFTPGATATFIGQQLGVDPLTVLNKQLELNDMDVLPPTPAMEIVNNLTPTQQRLLNKYKTPERSSRGFGGTGTFKPEVVPHGLGQTIQSSAKKYDVPPAILAGLVEAESSWKRGQVSPAGAIGMAQIMPATAQELGVDPRIPEQAIEGAAKYLRHIMDTKGVDINTALYMYNAGPNRGSYPYGQENKEYLQKVLKFSYKYGNGSQTLTNPQSFRSSVLAYVSGNIGPTSTGPHLDVKEVGGGNFAEDALDNFVEVEDPEFGKVSLSEIRKRTGGIGDNQAQHRARGSHGVDYGLYSGTKVYVKNGAKVVSSQPSEHGDIVTIKLPNGKQYTFLHGKEA